MGSGPSQTTNTSQQSSTQPWTPAQPLLMSILGQLGQAPTGATPDQLNAISQIQQGAGNIPGFGQQGANTVNQAFNLNTDPQQASLASGIGALSPMLSKNWMDPSTNPFLGPAMQTLNQDITNQIGGQFAAAGRPIGTNAAGGQALARGLAQGEGGLLANEFNTLAGQTQGAAGMLPGMTGAMTGQQMAPIQSGAQGMGLAGMLSSLFTQPGIANLSAAGLGAAAPTINLANLEQLGIPIAGLGAQSQGTSNSTTQQSSSPWSNLIGGAAGGLGLLGQSGAFGSAGWLGPLMMMSDEEVKDDIAPVGKLKDGSNVYSFKYKADPTRTTHIGLIAQEVEQLRPDAVAKIGGVRHVDYGKATERARNIGLLEDMLEAA